jgi:hypothetical protein
MINEENYQRECFDYSDESRKKFRNGLFGPTRRHWYLVSPCSTRGGDACADSPPYSYVIVTLSSIQLNADYHGNEAAAFLKLAESSGCDISPLFL